MHRKCHHKKKKYINCIFINNNFDIKKCSYLLTIHILKFTMKNLFKFAYNSLRIIKIHKINNNVYNA